MRNKKPRRGFPHRIPLLGSLFLNRPHTHNLTSRPKNFSFVPRVLSNVLSHFASLEQRLFATLTDSIARAETKKNFRELKVAGLPGNLGSGKTRRGIREGPWIASKLKV